VPRVRGVPGSLLSCHVVTELRSLWSTGTGCVWLVRTWWSQCLVVTLLLAGIQGGSAALTLCGLSQVGIMWCGPPRIWLLPGSGVWVSLFTPGWFLPVFSSVGHGLRDVRLVIVGGLHWSALSGGMVA
jgi:hypothetical protein